MLKADRCPRGQAVEVHGDRSVHGEAQGIIAVAPVFNEGDIRVSLGSKGSHDGMIPLERVMHFDPGMIDSGHGKAEISE